jgi:hypothetical protein
MKMCERTEGRKVENEDRLEGTKQQKKTEK